MRFLRIRINGDGNCLFTAIAAAHEGRAGLSKGWDYRRMAAEYMLQLATRNPRQWTPQEHAFVQHMIQEASDPEFVRILTNLRRTDEDRNRSRVSNTDLRYHKGVVLATKKNANLRKFLESYAKIMSSSRNMYGGGIEIAALAEVLKRTIVVHQLTPQALRNDRQRGRQERVIDGQTELMPLHGESRIAPHTSTALSNWLPIHLLLDVDGLHYDLLIRLFSQAANSKLLALELQAQEYKHLFRGKKQRLTPGQANALHRQILEWAEGYRVDGVNHRLNYTWWRNDPSKNKAFWAAAWNIMQRQRQNNNQNKNRRRNV